MNDSISGERKWSQSNVTIGDDLYIYEFFTLFLSNKNIWGITQIWLKSAYILTRDTGHSCHHNYNHAETFI